MTERAFAKKVGVSKTMLHRIENQEQNVTIDTLEPLCKRFKCNIDDLFPATAIDYCWSSSSDAFVGSRSWMVNFNYGS